MYRSDVLLIVPKVQQQTGSGSGREGSGRVAALGQACCTPQFIDWSGRIR